MSPNKTDHVLLWTTLLIALLLTIMALAGLFWPPTYARETSTAGGRSADAVNLVVVVPVLLVSGIMACRGSVPGHLVWLGAQGYLLYNLVFYTLALHFNALFLVYCATFGLCFYATVFSLRSLQLDAIAHTYSARAPRTTLAIIFFALSLLTAANWLKMDIPAILRGQVPESITPGMLVDPVHVLDFAFLLPAMFLTAVFLLRRRRVACVLAPALLGLLAIMSMEIATIGFVNRRMGLGANSTMIGFFVALAVGFAALLWVYLRGAH